MGTSGKPWRREEERRGRRRREAQGYLARGGAAGLFGFGRPAGVLRCGCANDRALCVRVQPCAKGLTRAKNLMNQLRSSSPLATRPASSIGCI